MRLIITFIFLIMTSCFSLAAGEPDEPATYDIRPPKGIMDYEELLEFLINRNPSLRGLPREEQVKRVTRDAENFRDYPVEVIRREFPPKKVDPCANFQSVYIRKNRLDTFQYRNEVVAGANKTRKDASGASVSFTKDGLADDETLTINGRVSVLLAAFDASSRCETLNPRQAESFKTGVFQWMFAGWVDGQGSTTNPVKSSNQSMMQAGADLQLRMTTELPITYHYLTLTPYGLTDFRSQASGYGFRLGWEPVHPFDGLNLGGRYGPADKYLDWFWMFRAEVDNREIERTGFTKLPVGRYNWIGGFVTFKFYPFPSLKKVLIDPGHPVEELLDRFSVSLSYQYHWDSISELEVDKFEAEFAYNLIPEGVAALTLRYSDGTDKDNLARTRKTILGLAVKY